MLGDNWVVVSEPAWSGWRVYIDERRVEWFYANEAFLGFYVPKGKHAIRVVFLPDAFVKGRAISLATLALVIVFAIARRLMVTKSRRRAVADSAS
jgi:uncharacterized membrane protein YfhO